jgi:hypothetical protein
MSNSPSYNGILTGMWLMGCSVSCYVAAMLANIVIIPREPIVFLVFTIVGGVSLVFGLLFLLSNAKKLGAGDPTLGVMKKPLIGLLLLTLISDVVLIVIANS